jgi:hypothetical protein
LIYQYWTKVVILLLLESLYQGLIQGIVRVYIPNALCCRSAAEQFTDNSVLIGEDKQNKTGSEADLSNSYKDSTKSIAGLNSRQTTLDTTILSSSILQSYNVDYKVSRAAKLDKSSTFVTKTVYIRRVCSLLKHKTRNTERQILGKSSTFGCYLLV